MTPRFFDNVDDTIRSLKNPSSGRHHRSKNDFIPAPSVGARRLSYWVDHGLLVVVDDRHEYACDHH